MPPDLMTRIIVAILGALFEGPQVPPGFPAVDPYDAPARGIREACYQTAEAEAPEKWRTPIFRWCLHRAYSSSRYGVVESRIDGSWLHDRDRPSASWFYSAAVRTGRIDPETCAAHRADGPSAHPGGCWRLAAQWPFKIPATLPDDKRARWFASSHDLERFGTRGPIDVHALTGYATIPGCYPPEAFDRFDVAAAFVVRRSVGICTRWGCHSKWDIKEHWSDRV